MAPDSSYRVTLAPPEEDARLRALGSPTSGLVWTGDEQVGSHTYLRTWSYDPEAGFVRNLLTGLFLLLPIDSQL